MDRSLDDVGAALSDPAGPGRGSVHHRLTVTRPIDFSLPDRAGGSFQLSEALRERTVVLLFYRGDW